MIITGIYVENYGKFSQFSMDFSEGINSIFQGNGWGKSTLTAFIKAMLYGMGSGRYSDAERKKYAPWNNGKYGGYLKFKVGDREYRVERTFGKTEKGDTFALYDCQTNLASNDYSDRLGDEIFGIDRESFESTVYISGDNQEGSKLTDMLSAILADVAKDEGDITNLNAALNLLDKSATKIKAKRGNGGSANAIAQEIKELEENLNQVNQARAAIETEEANIREYEAQISQLENERDSVHNNIDKYSVSSKKDEYSRLTKELELCKERLSNQKQFFNNNVPTKEEIEAMQARLSDYNAQVAISKENGLTNEQKQQFAEFKDFFRNGIPQTSELDRIQNEIFAYETAKQAMNGSLTKTGDIIRFEELKKRFSVSIPTDADIDRVSKICDNMTRVSNDLEQEKEKLEEAHRCETKASDNFKALMKSILIVSGIIVFVGLVVLMFVNPFFGIGLEIGGLITLVLGIIVVKPNDVKDVPTLNVADIEKNIQKFEQQYKDDEQEYKRFVKKYGRNSEDANAFNVLSNIKMDRQAYMELSEKIEAMNGEHSQASAKVAAIKALLDEFFSYFPAMDTDTYEGHLSIIRSACEQFREYNQKVRTHNQAVLAAKDHKNAISEFITRYYVAVVNPAEQVKSIANNYNEYVHAQEDMNKIQAQYNEFSTQNDVQSLSATVMPEDSLTELNVRQKEINESLTDITTKRNASLHKIEELKALAGSREEIENELANKRAELEELEEKYEVLNKSKEFLEIAGNNLSKRYAGIMNDTFAKYAKLLYAGENNYMIDTKLNVSVDSNGEMHDSKYFSSGERELMDLCVRLSLLEAVFKNAEAPVIVLDDPFVNMDSESISRAMKLIKELAKKYQIIYMVCHESRLN